MPFIPTAQSGIITAADEVGEKADEVKEAAQEADADGEAPKAPAKNESARYSAAAEQSEAVYMEESAVEAPPSEPSAVARTKTGDDDAFD